MIANIFRKSINFRLSTYAQKMKEAWDRDPSLVHESWDNYFKSGPTESTTSAKTATQDELRAK